MLASEQSDLALLGSQIVSGLPCLPADRLAARGEFHASALGEPLRAHCGELVIGCAQLCARIDTTADAPEPFSIHEAGTSQFDARLGAFEVLYRGPVQTFSRVIVAEKGS